MSETLEESRVSRKKMLKRMGVGAAALWTAPIVLSAETPAFAGALNKLCQKTALQTGQASCWVCPAANSPCGTTGCCFCFTLVSGCCFCGNDYFCGNVPPCGQCPSGWKCGITCCGTKDCIPPCGAISCPDLSVSGAKASG